MARIDHLVQADPKKKPWELISKISRKVIIDHISDSYEN
jgi:hypothetical protein